MSDPGQLGSLPSVVIVAGRLLPAGGVMGSIALAREDALPPLRRWLGLALIGLATALHFDLCFVSPSHSTFARTTAILYTAVILPALFPWWRRMSFNVALCVRPATSVNLIASQTVTGGVLLGNLSLGEIPSPSIRAGRFTAPAAIFPVLR